MPAYSDLPLPRHEPATHTSPLRAPAPASRSKQERSDKKINDNKIALQRYIEETVNRHKNTYAGARSPAKSVPAPSHEPKLVNMRYEEEMAEYVAKNFEEEGE